MKVFKNIFHNDLEPFDIQPPFQTKVTNDWNLIIDLITLLLTLYASSLTCIVIGWKLNIAQKHFSMTCEISNLLARVVSSILPTT
jgi:hypothetical protein